MDALTDQLQAVSLKESLLRYYVVDREADTTNAYHLTQIKLNFYQLWCMFGQAPCVNKGQEQMKLYEYKLKGASEIFSLYAWSIKGNLLNETKWNVATTSGDQVAIQDFLEHLFDAIQCYEKYYKGIEKKQFHSHISTVDQRLRQIREELREQRDFLQSL
jgi:hypothetical protein